MAYREHLLEIGSVRIAVKIDVADVEGIENRGQVVGRISRAVERSAFAEGPAAGGVQLHGPFLGGLQFTTIDGSRLAGAAIVHQQHIAPLPQRLEQRKVLVAG